MTGKRFYNESKSDQDRPVEIGRKRPRISLASVVGEVVMVNSLQNLFSSLEPLLRRVVNEEVEDVLRRRSWPFARSSSLRIEALEPSSLKLVFSKKLLLPIFTGSKIQDVDGNPLQFYIVDKRNADQPICLPHPVKVEIVVLDGDFPPGDDDSWTSQQFDRSIVKERTGKRPLLHGDLTITLRDGSAAIGDIEFTDNSSWIRSRKFRIGVRLVPGSNSQGLSVCEAMTEPFVVKDHRGELYKKHHPPKLEDEVWRLEKIGKEGAFHKKLSDVGIKTVQDFLKLSVIDAQRLRKTLGIGMSEKMWEVTLKHAMTCEMGNKRYIYRGDQVCVTLSPICQVVKVEINGQVCPAREINNHKPYFENLLKDACRNWDSLEVVDAMMSETALLTQGDMVDQQYPNHANVIDDKAMMAIGYSFPSNVQMDTDWMQVNTPFFYGVESNNRATISESSSDGDLASQGL